MCSSSRHAENEADVEEHQITGAEATSAGTATISLAAADTKENPAIELEVRS